MATSSPNKQSNDDVGEGEGPMTDDKAEAEPIVAFNRPPLPPVLGLVVVLSLLEVGSCLKWDRAAMRTEMFCEISLFDTYCCICVGDSLEMTHEMYTVTWASIGKPDEESERINCVTRRAAVVGPSTIREACSNALRSSASPKKMTATRSESCSSDMAVVEAAKRP
uniref:Uncharacterized protein n=1 Tax=Nelumbo nucifera TaxID=4432 RepID=A0A822Z8C8_NELNU|nr:TPA_asm: hypothetical protein HUJ06_015635 [Nelumbo nucifera]